MSFHGHGRAGERERADGSVHDEALARIGLTQDDIEAAFRPTSCPCQDWKQSRLLPEE
jgi:hypothetical protein